MRVIGFDEKEYIFNVNKLSHKINELSAPHKKAIEIIKSISSSAKIYSELSLPGCKGCNGVILSVDIYVPQLNLMVEVHGEQHYEYSKFFHKTKAGFSDYKKNDEIKAKWAELNEFNFVELKYDEEDKWKEQITNAAF